MQPPRITFEFSLILSLSVLTVGGQQGSDARTGNAENEAMERNKRLVPYVTYYVTQSRSEPRYEAAVDVATTTKSGVPNSERLRPSIFYPRFTESSSTRTVVYSSGEERLLRFHEPTGGMRKLNVVTVPTSSKFAISPQNARSALPQLIRIVPSISQSQPRYGNDSESQSAGVDLRTYDSRFDPGTDRPNRPRPVVLAVNESPAANAKVNHELGAHTSFGSDGVNPLDKTTGKLGTGISSLSKSKHNKETRIERLPRLRVPQENEIRFVVNLTPIVTAGHSSTALNAPGAGKAHSTTENDFSRPTSDGFLSVLSETSKLPKNLTPQNIDNGIKVLALILERLQKEKEGERTRLAQAQRLPLASARSRDGEKSDFGKFKELETFPLESGTSTPGRPGIDYPTHSSIPQTSFDCSTQRYKGFFGDPETECQVWHYCDLNGGQASFLCPNGTIFSQAALTCDWWFNVKCASTSQLYVLNERLYKYILPFSPSFPEDYSGPIVDRYLTAKFNEMERKSKIKAVKSSSSTKTPTTTIVTTTTTTTTNMPPKNEKTIKDRE